MDVCEVIKDIVSKSGGMFLANQPLIDHFGKDNVKYVVSDLPVPPHVKIKQGGKEYALVNKAYAETPDLIFDEMAVGDINLINMAVPTNSNQSGTF